ncbi:hypothetical protein RHMOL_Rhmol06G0158500 [Rhododendron molle]|uniref:Uncharacterized protein n=1 Tax=Rhododendron molle TaxID=49168 RepID=A0ACC0NET4_RHOML|nr:hypothetical protein RHMOL_Rhmol06G0158500 [Rhododendron molle]
MLLVRPEPIPPNYEDSRWSWFQNCLGALDRTYMTVNPPATDRPRYKSKKGEIATNVLGFCTRDLKFVYVLSGWERSVTDSRILQNAIERPEGLTITHVSKEEYFNMKHSAAENVIERSFGVLKMRFTILRSASHYPTMTQTRIETTCCLLHNLIKREMPNDPIEQEYDAWERDHVNDVPDDDHIAMDTNEVEVVDAPTKQKRRNWRTKEEDALMKCIVNELVGDKWRAENGFRCGFFNHMEKELEKRD